MKRLPNPMIFMGVERYLHTVCSRWWGNYANVILLGVKVNHNLMIWVCGITNRNQPLLFTLLVCLHVCKGVIQPIDTFVFQTHYRIRIALASGRFAYFELTTFQRTVCFARVYSANPLGSRLIIGSLAFTIPQMLRHLRSMSL